MNQSLLNEYEELLLQRDQLLLDADQIELQYVQAFGEARKNLFEEQIACIRCKKALAWYQQAHNHGLSVDPGQLKDYLDREMLSYQLQLSRMIRDNEAAADTRAVTPYEERRSRSLYRILARKLHPDMHPGLMGDDLLSGLWLRISAAYHNFDVKALTELTVLADRRLRELGIDPAAGLSGLEDLEARIEEVREEIVQITSCEPYTYRSLLEDEEAVALEQKRLAEELARSRASHAELDTLLQANLEEGGTTLTWLMN
ncbi:MAG: hypothetical protein IJU99_01290 [Lachnospiraceae bacterium]|nr:hypothetical protein [Lachnospiraceae bacterium]